MKTGTLCTCKKHKRSVAAGGWVSEAAVSALLYTWEKSNAGKITNDAELITRHATY